jgi:hypothetical protein
VLIPNVRKSSVAALLEERRREFRDKIKGATAEYGVASCLPFVR